MVCALPTDNLRLESKQAILAASCRKSVVPVLFLGAAAPVSQTETLSEPGTLEPTVVLGCSKPSEGCSEGREQPRLRLASLKSDLKVVMRKEELNTQHGVCLVLHGGETQAVVEPRCGDMGPVPTRFIGQVYRAASSLLRSAWVCPQRVGWESLRDP